MDYQKTNGGPFKGGKVLATDAKFTGEEPLWFGWESWDKTKFLSTRDRALRFYNYYLSPGDLKPSVLEWMNRNGFSPEDIKLVQNGPAFVPESTASKLARMILKGMPGTHQIAGTDDQAYILRAVQQGLRDLKSGMYDKDADKPAKKTDEPQLSPLDRIRIKVGNTILPELDKMLDKWIMARDKGVMPLNLYEVLGSYEIAPQGLSLVTAWLDKQLAELTSAQSGDDDQLVEAYAHLSKKSLKSRIEGLEAMKGDVVKYLAAKKSARKPRKKKVKTAEKQTSRIKFMAQSKEFSLNSVSPLTIPGAQQLWVFNTKYKTLSYYVASGHDGFSVRGTSVKGFDKKASFTQTLRKPDQILPAVLGKTPLQLRRILDDLTTKRRVPNGRINEDTVLLRAMTNPA